MFTQKNQVLAWALAALFGTVPLNAQQTEPGTNFSTWFPITEFPDAQTVNLSHWQAEAQRIAGADLWSHYQHRCINSAQKYPELGSLSQADGFIAPARPFDSLFFVGTSGVSAWVIDTGDGLILIDALWDKEQAERVLVPGLENFGYEGTDVKALIITHEHIDHYGGAKWLQETFDMPVYCSEKCWEGLAEAGDGPTKDQVLEDGQDFTVGNTTLSVFSTPGHTPGTLSFIIPLRDRGEEHLAGLYGGGGIPSGADDKATQIESFQKFAQLAEKRGVDVLISNHQTQDHTLQNLDVLANRLCDEEGCSLPNPYVVGTDVYVRYLKVMEMCVRVKAARENQDLRV